MARFLVTGGAGFIGSHIAAALVQRGGTVRILDNFLTGKRANITHLASPAEIIEGDICNSATLHRAMNGVDYCLHQAAIPSVPRSVADPAASNDANVSGSLAVYLAARDAGVKRVVVASSSSVYGPGAPVPTPESAPLAPASPYAVTKAAADMYAAVCSALYGIDIVCLRYFNVFGPRQDPQSQYAAVVPKFITSLLRGEAPEIHGDGSQSRDFSYIDNVVEANLTVCGPDRPMAGAYNVACGTSTSVLELYNAISGILGVEIPPIFTEPRVGDIPNSLADCRKARDTFGYTARISVREGLERTVGWYRKNWK